jgi:hypothetical protein
VPVEAGRPPDLYERAYMPGEGAILHRDKRRAPWQMHALFGTIAGLYALLGVLQPWALVALPPLLMLWLLFAVLRVSVSEGHVNVQFGLFGPRIPMAAIESAELMRYDWKAYGGWGIRRPGERVWAYNMPGDGGQAVRIVWHDARGQRTTVIGSSHAAGIADAIARARKALPAAATPAALPPKKAE